MSSFRCAILSHTNQQEDKAFMNTKGITIFCAIFLIIGTSCGGSPNKKEVEKKGKWNAIVFHGLSDRGGGSEKDGKIDGLLSDISYNPHPVSDFDGLKKAIKEQNATLFYYWGHSQGEAFDSTADIHPDTSINWKGFWVDRKVLTPGEIEIPKSVYTFVFMNCCWSMNGEGSSSWIKKLHPEKDTAGIKVETECIQLGWYRVIGRGAAADFADRFFKNAKMGKTIAISIIEAKDESQTELKELWVSGSKLFPGLPFADPIWSPLNAAEKIKLYGAGAP